MKKLIKIFAFIQIFVVVAGTQSALVLAVSGQDLDAVYKDMVWLPGGICDDASGSVVGSSVASFERSKLDLYESQSSADPGGEWAQTSEARNYAINDLKIPEADIKQYDKNEVIAMMKAEIAVQFAQLPDKYNSTLQQAQQAILSYQEHENDSFQLFDKDGVPIYDFGDDGSAVIGILSLANWMFKDKGKNKRVAASYDIKYAIYLGVKEHMGEFTNNATGTGEDRWKSTIAYVFLPSDPNRYWTDSRSQVAIDAWEMYANLAPDVIDNCSCSATSSSQVTAAGFPSETIEYYKSTIEPKIKELQSLYMKASEQFDFPWELIAALHFRESSFAMANPPDPERPGTSQGVWQLYTLTRSGKVSFTPGAIDDEEFIRQTGMMIEFLRGKQSGNSPENKTPPISNSNKNVEIIKDTLWGYNGRVDYSQNDPEDLYDKGYDTAGYVMNMFDAYRTGLMIDTADSGTVLGPDQRPGVFTVYSLIAGNSGSICTDASGVGISADGFVFPVKALKNQISWCSGQPPDNGNCHGTAWGGSIVYYAYDLMAAAGTPLVAVRPGYIRRVSTSGESCSGGPQASFWLESDDGFWYFYQHTDAGSKPAEGAHVEAGQTISAIGKSAYVGGGQPCRNTSPHLHIAAGSERIGSMYRGCSQSSCPNMNKMIDISQVLTEAYNAIPQ